MDARASGHHQRQQKFVGFRSVGDTDFHRIEMAAHVGSIDVGDGHVEARAGAAHFFGGSHDGFGVAENFAHGIAPGDVPQRAVLEFSCLADDGALPVSFHNFRIAAERRHKSLCHFQSERVQIFHETGDFRHVFSGKRIVNDRERGGAPQRCDGDRTTFVENFFDNDDALAELHFRHARDSFGKCDESAREQRRNNPGATLEAERRRMNQSLGTKSFGDADTGVECRGNFRIG